MLALQVVLLSVMLSVTGTAFVPNLANAAIIQAGISRTNSTLESANSPGVTVDPQVHPDWAGPMDPDDCRRVRIFFQGRVEFYKLDKPIEFWSRQGAVEPEGDNFELPFGWRYGTCTLLLRMFKDFGDDVLPLEDDTSFAKTSKDPAKALFSWNDVLERMDEMLVEIKRHKLPEWAPGYGYGGSCACILYLPKSSPMSRRWTADMRSQRTMIGNTIGDMLLPIRNATGIPVNGTYPEQS